MRRPLHTWDKKPLPPEASETGHPAGQRPRCNTAAAFQVREPSTCTKALCAVAALLEPFAWPLHLRTHSRIPRRMESPSWAWRWRFPWGRWITPPRPLQLVVAVQGGATGRWQLAPGLEARLRGLLCQCGIAPEPAIRFASTLLGSWHFPGGCKARGTWHTCSLGWRKLQVLGSCEKPSKTCCSRPERPATTFLNLFCRSSSSIRASSK